MSIEKLVARYINSADHVYQTLEFVEQLATLHTSDIRRVAETAKAYLDDAKHFMREQRFEVSLTAVAYCEGLLDALRLLGAVRFEWPSKLEPERKR
jgi:FAD synthetase